MAITRRKALKRLVGLSSVVEHHLEKIREDPNSPSISHWKHEVHQWLRQMEELIPHLGRKTSAEWADRVKAWRQKIDE